MVLTGPLIGPQSGKGAQDQPGLPVADLSPEARKRQALHAFQHEGQRERAARMALLARIWLIIKRVAFGCFNDGLIHAGNLAYMSLLAIFPAGRSCA
jgi:membrane protein